MPDVRFTVYGFKAGIGSYGGTDTRADRTMAVRYNDIINVKDFGATGNGSTNDTAAINAAIDYAWELGYTGGHERGSIVYFPPGTYLIGSPPLFLDRGIIGDGKTHGAHIMYLGSGRDVSTLVGNYGTGEDLEDINSGFLVQAGGKMATSNQPMGGQILGLRDLSIINNSTVVNSGALLIMSSGTNLNMTNCHFHGYIGVSHDSNVFVSSIRNCVYTCSVPYTACNAATKAPEYTDAKFQNYIVANIDNVVKINSTTAEATTVLSHGLPSGTFKGNLMFLEPLDWTPNGGGSERLLITNTGANTFTYTLNTTPATHFKRYGIPAGGFPVR